MPSKKDTIPNEQEIDPRDRFFWGDGDLLIIDPETGEEMSLEDYLEGLEEKEEEEEEEE